MPDDNKIVSIVDDEVKTAQLFHNALCTIKGINVFEFTDPVKALQHLKLNKKDYAVMISDLRMPVINGVTVIENCKGFESFSKNDFNDSK